VDAFARPSFVSILGVPLRVSRAWLAISAILLAITIDSLRPANSPTGWYIAAAVVVLGVIASILIHEIAHVLAARRSGGQVLAIEPAMFGALSDDAYLPTNPRSEALVAGSGPVVSLLLAAIFGAFWGWVLPDNGLASGTAGFLALINLALFAGNAMPGFPLDGGRIFRAFVWFLTDDVITGTKMAAAYGQAISLFCFILGALLLSLGDALSIWGAWGLIAVWSIHRAGREGYLRTVWRETSRDLTIDDVGLGNSRRIDADRTIDEAIDDILQGTSEGPILVRDGGEVIGVVTIQQLRKIPRSIWPERQIRDITLSVENAPRIQYDAQLVDLAQLFEDSNSDLILVETRGKITGALERHVAIPRARERVRSIRMRQRKRPF
jgi:Zn-dependent protease